MFFYINLFFSIIFIHFLNKLVIFPYLQSRKFKQQYGSSVSVQYFPIFGGFMEILRQMKKDKDPFEFFRKKRHQNNNLKLRFAIGIKDKPFISVIDPYLLKQYFMNEHNYEKRNEWMFMDKKNKNTHGLAEAEGENWKKQRQILSQIFHFQNVSSLIPQVQKVIDQQMKSLKVEQNVNVIRFCESITGKAVINTFFGDELLEKWDNKIEIEQEMKNILVTRAQIPMMSILYRIRAMIFGDSFSIKSYLLTEQEKQLKERFDNFKEYCTQYIDQKIKQNKANNLPEKEQKMFINLIIQKYIEGQLTYEQIFSNFCNFFFAGMDTTGTFSGTCLYWAAKYPHVQEKLYQEIKEFEKNNGQIKEIQDLNQFQYMNNFIKECFRFFTPAPGTLLRIAKKDHYLGEFFIKKGWIVSAFFNVDTTDSKLIDNCDKFDPDRWNSPQMKNLDPYQFTPFSAGPRNCIGQTMALVETKLIILNILKKYKANAIKDKQLKLKLDIIVTLKDDELIYLNERK